MILIKRIPYMLPSAVVDGSTTIFSLGLLFSFKYNLISLLRKIESFHSVTLHRLVVSRTGFPSRRKDKAFTSVLKQINNVDDFHSQLWRREIGGMDSAIPA